MSSPLAPRRAARQQRGPDGQQGSKEALQELEKAEQAAAAHRLRQLAESASQPNKWAFMKPDPSHEPVEKAEDRNLVAASRLQPQQKAAMQKRR